MNELFFWKSWTRPERVTFWGITLLILLSLSGLFILSPLSNGGNSVPWDILTKLTETVIPANWIDFGNFSFTIQTPTVVVTEEYIAPLLLPDITNAKVFLVVALLGLSIAFAALTTLSRFWYMGGLALFILLVVFSRTEFLVLNSLPERALLLLILILYGGTGYYFQAFKIHTPTPTRILIFIFLTAILAFGTGLLTTTPEPAYAFLVYSMPFWLVLSVIFLLVSATEIWYGLIWLTTSSITGMGKRALPNFLVIGFIYLLILVFAYVGNTKMANWGMVIVPAYLLGTIAAILGFWGFKPRCESTEGHLPFRETGFWLYTGLFLITIALTAMAFSALNDPLLEVLEDTVINGQLGMGAAFLFYIILNFYPLLKDGLKVHRILYKPLKFSLTRTRVIGVGLVVVLFSMQNLFPIKQSIAAYFNGLGDWHTVVEDHTLAEQYYQMSIQQEFQNHKANYALASLARIQGDKNAAVYFFRQATLKKPSPQAYVGLSNLLMEDNLYFESLYNLREGISKFPDNGPLLNNLGLLYSQTNLADSAYYFLSAAEQVSKDPIPTLNIIGTMMNVLDAQTLASLLKPKQKFESVSWDANRLAIQNLVRQFQPENENKRAVLADSLLNAAGFAYWLNFLYNQGPNDENLAAKANRLVLHNDLLADELLLAAAHADFYGGDKIRALETLLTLLRDETQHADLYRKIIAHWFLQLGLYDKAIDYFSLLKDVDGIVGHAIAQALSGNPVSGALVLEALNELSIDSIEVGNLREKVIDLKPPHTVTDSLLAEALQSGSESKYLEALRSNPFHPTVVVAYTEFLLKNGSRTEEAYQVLVNAMRFNESAPEIWAEYALLNLELGLTDLAEEAKQKVAQWADSTAYHHFLTRYQAKWSLKQKLHEEFR